MSMMMMFGRVSMNRRAVRSPYEEQYWSTSTSTEASPVALTSALSISRVSSAGERIPTLIPGSDIPLFYFLTAKLLNTTSKFLIRGLHQTHGYGKRPGLAGVNAAAATTTTGSRAGGDAYEVSGNSGLTPAAFAASPPVVHAINEYQRIAYYR